MDGYPCILLRLQTFSAKGQGQKVSFECVGQDKLGLIVIL